MAKDKSKKTGKASTKKPVPVDLRLAAESRTALSATVAWTLSLMSTLAAEAIGFVSLLFTRYVGPNEVLAVLAAVMLFVALVAGIVTLVMTPVVLKLAKTRPPSLIVQTAYVAGALPILVFALQYLRR